MVDYIIRLAKDEDLELLFNIWLDGINNSFDISLVDKSLLLKRFERNFSQRHGVFNFWVAESGDQGIVGWQSLIKTSYNPFREDIYAEASTYIAKNCRFKGLGKILLAHVISEASKTDLQYLIGFVTATNKAARKITYETGWVEVGEIPSSLKAANSHPKILLVRPV